jgi:CRP/FNR family cyclic AMP-dependent transcriptional regulator
VFGEMALVDQSTRAATAVAETECKLLAINRNAFLQLVKTSPAFGAALLSGLAERAKEMAGRNK